MDALFWISILIGLGGAGVTVAALALAARRSASGSTETGSASLTLLFEDGQLIDADNAIWPLLDGATDRPEWEEVRTALLPVVPNLPETLEEQGRGDSDADVRVTVRTTEHGHRLILSPCPTHQRDWFTARQNDVDVTRLRPALIYAPDPIWSLSHEGTFLWGNDAFMAYAVSQGGADAFACHVSDLLSQPEVLRSKRLKLDTPGIGRSRWLEVTTKETDAGMLFFAASIDAVVRAEEAQRNFVQTLSKTFANLTTGLAIFDRDRRLVLFNPALIDLSGVSVEFLSGRPALFEFFDKLREQQIMPEPKNYDDWRERMAKLVAAASDDRFRETWNLAGGQTFDVTGRPYPDGAIAFLFNDITAEVSLTRGFRTELETMQSMLDVMEDAVAVFNQQGILTVCNAAYKAMWQVDPDTCLTESTILDATQEWKSAFHPSPVWPELRDFVTTNTERASWDSELRSKDGREVICRIDPICYGATLIRFCRATGQSGASSEKDGLQIVSA
ncbi:PAS-domain containing protein [Marivita sp.]|uniref:PAS-domain containing protein n=1 Tax=Marivita sp. TaxID=2003365 RepID=UPI0025BD3768|nr:PAS-domain containing protein [Marivita sp.]